MAEATANILIRARNTAGKEFRLLYRDIKSYERRIRSSFRAISSFALSAKGALAGFGLAMGGRAMVRAFAEQQQAVEGLGQALKTAGRYTPALHQALRSMASDMQRNGIFGDEALIDAQKILVTFGKISDDMIPRAIQAVADLAAATKMDLGAAANLIAKASVGVTDTLTRYGIVIPEAVKKTKDFGAILQSIEGRVHGFNKALGETGTGELIKFKNALGDLMEKGGEFIVIGMQPAVRALSQSFADMTGDIDVTKESSRSFFKTLIAGAGFAANGIKLIEISVHGLGALFNELVYSIAKVVEHSANMMSEVNKYLGTIFPLLNKMGVVAVEKWQEISVAARGASEDIRADIKLMAAEMDGLREGDYAEDWITSFNAMAAEIDRAGRSTNSLGAEIKTVDDLLADFQVKGPDKIAPIKKEIHEVNREFERIAGTINDNVMNGLQEMVEAGRSSSETWRKTALSIVLDLARIAMQAAITRAAMALGGGGSQGGGGTAFAGGAASSAISGIGAMAGSLAVAGLSQKYGAAQGGIFDVSRIPVRRMSDGGIADSSEIRIGRGGAVETGEAGPEAYIPLSRNRKIPIAKVEGGRGPTIVINAMDGQDVVRVLMRYRKALFGANQQLAMEYGS